MLVPLILFVSTRGFPAKWGFLGDVFPTEHIVGVGMSDFAFNKRFLHET